jgi:hypothetical protein
MSDSSLADQLLRDSGGVGDVSIRPRYVGDVAIRPRYVGAPVSQVGTQGQPGQPVEYSPEQYIAGDVTWFGIGENVVPAGSTGTTFKIKPERPMTPQSFRSPSTVQRLYLKAISIAGTNIFASEDGVPIEFFSEVSTAPQILFPTINPSTGVALTVSNPSAVDKIFSGAFYGTAMRS